MRNGVRAALVAGLSAASLAAGAGTVEQAHMQGSVAINVANGDLKGCTYRSVSVALADGSNLFLDVSFGLHDRGFALVKGGALRATRFGANAPKPEVLRIDSFWLKASGAAPTKPLGGKVLPSESPPGYLMYGIELSSLIDLLSVPSGAQPLLVGVRLRGRDLDVIHSGRLQLSAHDMEQGAACFAELIDRIRAKVDEPAVQPGQSAPK